MDNDVNGIIPYDNGQDYLSGFLVNLKSKNKSTHTHTLFPKWTWSAGLSSQLLRKLSPEDGKIKSNKGYSEFKQSGRRSETLSV